MKRNASPIRERRLKSRRLDAIFGLSLLERQQPLATCTECDPEDPDKTNFSRAVVLCEEYNSFLTLTKYHRKNNPFSQVARSGSAFQAAVRDVEQIVQEARMKVEAKCVDMECHLDDFIVW